MVQEVDYKRKWWKESVVYQIYPRSFMDTNGDGIGDLKGIISKLDYLHNLGVDVIWICPFYKTPNADNGYDISDYYAVSEEFGTMADFEQLLSEAHRKGIKVIADLVLNHTSDEHPWFVESRESKDSPKRDFYIWKKAKENKEPPSNWASFFGGSAWEYDEQSAEYYLHLFTQKQPDLNWENPLLIEELHRMVRWWLDKGLDGFRIDAINHIVKMENYPDAEAPAHEKIVSAHHLCSNLPKVHDHIQNLNREVFSHYDIMTVGEAANTGPEEALLYVDENRAELNMVIHFEHLGMDSSNGGLESWEKTPWSIDDYRDVVTHQFYRQAQKEGWTEDRIMRAIHQSSRDNARTPMQWNDQAHGGFTTGTPWVQANPNARWINVESAVKDPNSILNYYKKLISLRKEHLVAVYGKYESIFLENTSILAFSRTLRNEQLVVVMNFSAASAHVEIPEVSADKSIKLLLSNVESDLVETRVDDRLQPYEARIYLRGVIPC
ncbi:alpha-glucosidase [Cohnella faecalis]|uniref:Alpha-glucosidase n=1 Tax=Cohnella faecalis TaxID=2315694 RepID=A0A398CFR6_9BACL|nr:alpha-glucosidase [Cohnella faecalis]RIE01563.1 alpha-glucosidase [Cohnella faecalis]